MSPPPPPLPPARVVWWLKWARYRLASQQEEPEDNGDKCWRKLDEIGFEGLLLESIWRLNSDGSWDAPELRQHPYPVPAWEKVQESRTPQSARARRPQPQPEPEPEPEPEPAPRTRAPAPRTRAPRP